MIRTKIAWAVFRAHRINVVVTINSIGFPKVHLSTFPLFMRPFESCICEANGHSKLLSVAHSHQRDALAVSNQIGSLYVLT